MLVSSRKIGEKIAVDKDILIEFLEKTPLTVKIRISIFLKDKIVLYYHYRKQDIFSCWHGTLKIDEKIIINNNIEFRILAIDKGAIKVGLEAPKQIIIKF